MDTDEKQPEAAIILRLRRGHQLKRTSRKSLVSLSRSSKTKSTPASSLTRFLFTDASAIRENAEPENGLSYCTQRVFSLSDCSSPVDERHLIVICKKSLKTILFKHLRSAGGNFEHVEDIESGRTNPENASEVLKTYEDYEVNALLLYASFFGRGELIPYFQAVGADLHHAEPEQGLTSLHLCAFSDCLTGVKYLVDNGADVNSQKTYTPFQVAAFGNSCQVAEYFLSRGVGQENTKHDDTVLHCAARSNAPLVINLIAEKNPALDRLDWTGHAPIHYAAAQGFVDCLRELLLAGCEVNATTVAGFAAIHLAAAAGCSKSLEVLLANGADASRRLSGDHTALHLAAKILSVESVEELLKNGMSDADAVNDNGCTALHFALSNSIPATDVCKLLVARMIDVNRSDKKGYTPLHDAVLWDQYSSIEVLIQHGADLSAKTNEKWTALAMIQRQSPGCLKAFKQRLDAAIQVHQNESANDEVKLMLDFTPLLQHGRSVEAGYIEIFAREQCQGIVNHPLCQSFLHLKWMKMRKFFVARIMFHLLHSVVLTAWVLAALSHNCYNESHGVFDNGTIPLCDQSRIFDGYLHEHPKFIEFLRYAITVMTVLELLRIFSRRFFTQMKNSVEMIVESCEMVAFLASCLIIAGRTYPWQHYLGAFAVLLSWFKAMLMMGQLPLLDLYVAMFTSIQAQVFKLLLAYSCLLMGFATSFYLIFPHSKSFSNPLTAIIKVMVMMTGEIEFGNLFFPEKEPLLPGIDENDATSRFIFQISTYICFLLFALFVTVILMNLFLGIAINDIEDLQRIAGQAKMGRHAKMVCELEAILNVRGLPQPLMELCGLPVLQERVRMPQTLIVCPFNRWETQLPPDLLAAAHKIVKNRESTITNDTWKENESIPGIPEKRDAKSTPHRDVDSTSDRTLFKNIEKLQDQVIELRKICDENQKLVQDLVKSLATDVEQLRA